MAEFSPWDTTTITVKGINDNESDKENFVVKNFEDEADESVENVEFVVLDSDLDKLIQVEPKRNNNVSKMVTLKRRSYSRKAEDAAEKMHSIVQKAPKDNDDNSSKAPRPPKASSSLKAPQDDDSEAPSKDESKTPTKASKLECPVCDIGYFANKGVLKNHIRKNHAEEDDKTCAVCKFTCPDFNYLLDHLESAHNRGDVSIPAPSSSSTSDGDFDRRIRCFKCDFRSADIAEISSHYYDVHTPEEEKRQEGKKRGRPKRTMTVAESNPSRFKMRTMTDVDADWTPRESRKEGRPSKRTTTVAVSKLRRMIVRKSKARTMSVMEPRTRTKAELKVYEVNPKTPFMTQKGKRRQRTLSHSPSTLSPESSSIVCQYCQHEMVTKSALDKHVKAVHLDQRDFECPECGKRFVDKGELTRHGKKYHYGVADKCCEEAGCDFKAVFFCDLRSHALRRGHMTTERLDAIKKTLKQSRKTKTGRKRKRADSDDGDSDVKRSKAPDEDVDSSLNSTVESTDIEESESSPKEASEIEEYESSTEKESDLSDESVASEEMEPLMLEMNDDSVSEVNNSITAKEFSIFIEPLRDQGKHIRRFLRVQCRKKFQVVIKSTGSHEKQIKRFLKRQKTAKEMFKDDDNNEIEASNAEENKESRMSEEGDVEKEKEPQVSKGNDAHEEENESQNSDEDDADSAKKSSSSVLIVSKERLWAKPVKTSFGFVRCSLCPTVTVDEKVMSVHVNSCHPQAQKKDFVFFEEGVTEKCALCGCKINQVEEMKSHWINAHNVTTL